MTSGMIPETRNHAEKTSRDSGELLRVLLVEDNAADSELVLRELKRAGFDVTSKLVQAAEEFRLTLEEFVPDIVLADYNLGQWRGMEALEIIRNKALDIPLILVSGALGEVTAVECIKQGVTDYVLKDSLPRLPISIRRALREQRLRAQRKQAENELALKVEELARSNRDLEQFAYVASHDLQEPLRMVAMYTQLLAERYRGKLDEQADKYIHYAVDGALRMQTLVQDLLAFSRAGREGTKMSPVDCNLVMRQILKNLEAAIREKNAVIKHDALPTVRANSSQLQQVLQNLVNNAIKFHGEKAPEIEVRAERNKMEWEFFVSDNGIGIAQEHADRIFVIFQRLHTREEYPGNGIGLSICKKIVERHGGRIWAESGVHGGTTFHFTVPAPDEKENAASRGAEPKNLDTKDLDTKDEEPKHEPSGSLVSR
ncbi:MAG TPA: ATP-binding protein [Terriglobales bacterium]|nr:ATP-binding protein [Terriglobales bacterium]